MIVCVENFKGGSAKTTTAIHIAAYLQTLGSTILADGDIVQTPEPKNQIALPLKPEPPKGKRSTAGCKQKAGLLKEESVARASERLKRRNDRTDFSDLVQALLEAWLETPE
jgi:Mrp family chromosome partitioning ATPase